MINVWSVSQMLEDTEILTAEETKRAIPFCVSVCSEMSKRLKDVKFEDEPAVILACAGIVLYRFSLLCGSSSEDFESFKAGDVTISRSATASIENAVKFRDEALVGAKDFFTDIDFVFEAVEV